MMTLVLAALVALTGLAAGCKADLPQISAGDGSVDIPCTTFADQLVAYTPAGGGNSDAGMNALGMTDSASVTVDPDTALTVGFIGLGGVVDATGDDIAIHGSAVDNTSVTAYVSGDGNQFVFAGTLDGTITTLDLANAQISLALYVQLVGQSGALSVDSLEALQTTCPK